MGLQEVLDRYTRAFLWCRKNQVVIEFFQVYGRERVSVRTCGGYPQSERHTFLGAVEACMEQDHEERT